MLKVAGAWTVRLRSLTRLAAADAFEIDARGSHSAACRQSDRARVDRLHRSHKLAAKSGTRSSQLAQVSIVDIDGRTAFSRVVVGGQAEDQRAHFRSAGPCRVSAGKVVNVLMPIA